MSKKIYTDNYSILLRGWKKDQLKSLNVTYSDFNTNLTINLMLGKLNVESAYAIVNLAARFRTCMSIYLTRTANQIWDGKMYEKSG